MKPELISLESLQRAAREYSEMLNELPGYELGKVCEALGLNLIEDIEGEHVLLNARRKDGLLRPYVGEVEAGGDEKLMEVVPSVLKVRTGYMQLTDNVANYKQQRITVKAGRHAGSGDGKHPYEVEILRAAIATMQGDVARALFPGKYDPADLSPTGVFDGFLTILQGLVDAKEIAQDRGNYLTIAPGAAAKTALEVLQKRLGGMLTDGDVDVLCDRERAQFLREVALLGAADKAATHEEVEARLAALLGVRGRLRLLGTPLYPAPPSGKGGIILCRPGTLTVGLGKRRDVEAVRVRSPYNDPNVVQFWMQADVGTRVDQWGGEVLTLVEFKA